MTFRQVDKGHRLAYPVATFYSKSLCFNKAAAALMPLASRWTLLVDDTSEDIAFVPADDSDPHAYTVQRFNGSAVALTIGGRFISARGLAYRRFRMEARGGMFVVRVAEEVRSALGTDHLVP
jgi:hypothetical protein